MGYNNRGTSNNAANSYSRGLVPPSKITKEYLKELDISVQFAKFLIKINYWEHSEGRHTGRYRNYTFFYSIDDLKKKIELDPEEFENEKKIFKEYKEADARFKKEVKDIADARLKKELKELKK